MEAYCKKLIDEDGGFILSSGCAVPANVKPEKFRAMIETGKNHEFSKDTGRSRREWKEGRKECCKKVGLGT